MKFLKADTATKVVIGPVVAVGDGFTPVTTLSLSTADEAEILKHDAAAVTDISGNTFAAITSADGYYNLTITAAQLDTEGRMTVLINDDSLCLPVRSDFMVVNANVYDSLFAAAATDYLQVDTLQVGGTAQTANDNGADINTILSRIIGTLAAGSHNPQSGDAYAIVNNGTYGNAALDTDLGTLLTRIAQTLNLTALGNIGIDWANVENPGSAVDLAATDIQLADTASNVSALGGQAISAAGGITIHSHVGVNSTAQAALEDQYDGTGLSGSTYPATQAQLANIVNTGSAVNVVAESYVLTTGTQSANTYVATGPLDGTRHEHTDTAGAMDLYYQYDVGSDGTPSSVTMTGYLVGGNDVLGVYAYNWAGASWDQIGSLTGGAASNDAYTYALYTSHVGTGANLGKVRIRYYAASGLTTATLAIDQQYVSYAVVPISLQTKGSVSDLTPTASGFDTDLNEANTAWDDALLVFTSGSLSGESKPITSYLNANGAMTFDEPFSAAPANGDDFVVIHTHIHPVSQITADIDANSTQLAAILADTNELQTDDVPGLIAALNNVSVSDILTTQMAESYAANGTAPTLAQAIFAIHQMLMEFAISGTSITVKQLDSTTTAFIVTLDDGTSPTSATR